MSGPLDSCGKGGSVRRHGREPGFPFPPPGSGPWVQCWSAESQGYLRGTTVTIAWNQCGLGLTRGFPASVGQTLLQVCLQMCKADWLLSADVVSRRQLGSGVVSGPGGCH